MSSPPKVRSLVIDGGASRILHTTLKMARLEERIAELTGNPQARLVEYFDVLAGSSSGVILAAQFSTRHPTQPGKPLYSAEEVHQHTVESTLDSFKNTYESPSHFFDNFLRHLLPRGAWKDRFDGRKIDRLVGGYLQKGSMGDLVLPTLLTALDLDHRRPTHFRSHDHYSPERRKQLGILPADPSENTTPNLPVIDVCRGGAACPTYFATAALPTSKADPSQRSRFVDGGFYSASPILASLADISLHWEGHPGPSEVLIASFGVSDNPPHHIPSGGYVFGWNFGLSMVNLIGDYWRRDSHFQAQRIYRKIDQNSKNRRYFRINLTAQKRYIFDPKNIQLLNATLNGVCSPEYGPSGSSGGLKKMGKDVDWLSMGKGAGKYLHPSLQQEIDALATELVDLGPARWTGKATKH